MLTDKIIDHCLPQIIQNAQTKTKQKKFEMKVAPRFG